ncbi:MAG TPA: hypothetical protein VNR86_03210 [Sphingomicrobium sp.]|nr:hypothetical protein [Sphingomicrobium sp.]
MVMRMHRTLIVLPLVLLASPALAQPYPPQAFQLPPELTDPVTMQRVAGALETASQALLNVRIGDMHAAIEGREASPRERNETVGDLVRRKDPNFDRDIRREVAVAGPKIGRAMKALNRALPELERSLAQASEAIDRATANLPDPTYPRR